MKNKPKIFGFNNGGRPGFMIAVAIAEDGLVLAQHLCSHEGFMRHDLGMDGMCTWKHDTYNEHYPNGWETEFVPSDQLETHIGLNAALDLNQKLKEERVAKEILEAIG